MPVMDEFREEREALKHGTPKQKLQYFWDYYRWPTIIGICLFCAAVSFIYHLVTAKDTALYGAFLNCYATEESSAPLLEEFMELADIDPTKEEILIDTSMMISEDAMDDASYNAVQKMTVLIAASELDMIAGNDFAFERYVYTGSMADLREILSPEQIAAYEPYFYYMDMAVYEKIEEARDNLDDLSGIPYPDPRDPESMEDPVPVGLFLEYTDKLTDRYSFMGESATLGVVANSPRKETAALFIDYLFQ